MRSINLERMDRIPSSEILEHRQLIAKLADCDPRKEPGKAAAQAYKKLDIDSTWGLPREFSALQQGETRYFSDNNTGQSYFGISPTMKVYVKPPFDSPEEVLEYDPLEGKQAGLFSNLETYEEDQKLVGESTLIFGWFYNTLFMWPINTFGWELFMTTAALYPDKFGALMKKFVPLSKRYFEELAESQAEVIITHDDLTIGSGPVFRKAWYMKYIFPWYEEIWDPVKKAGKKLIFCSDGDLTCFLDDLVSIGVDGFMVEPLVDLEYLAGKFGKNKVIIGGIDTRVLTFGDKKAIRSEVERVTHIFRNCSGYSYMASGSLPGNIPLENLLYYFDICKEYGNV